MAIKRTKKEAASTLPEKLDDLLLKGMTATCLQKEYKEMYDDARNEIVEYLEDNTDGFEIEVSKGLKTQYGAMTYKQRANYEVDADKLIELVEAGKISVATLVHLIPSSKGPKLMEIGAGEAVTEKDPTEYLELRPNSEFKEKVSSEFTGEVEVEKPTVKSTKKVKVTKEESVEVELKEDDKAASLARIKEAAAKGKKGKSEEKPKKDGGVDYDLESILSE